MILTILFVTSEAHLSHPSDSISYLPLKESQLNSHQTSLDGLKTVNSLNTDLVVAQDQCHSAISELKNQTQVLPSQMNSNDGLKSSLDVSKPGTLSQNQCPLFYAIPSEIKSMVYRELLVTDEPVKDAHERLDSKVTIFLKDFQPISSIDARILRTCKVIYKVWS